MGLTVADLSGLIYSNSGSWIQQEKKSTDEDDDIVSPQDINSHRNLARFRIILICAQLLMVVLHTNTQKPSPQRIKDDEFSWQQSGKTCVSN